MTLLLIFAGLVFLHSLVSARLERTVVVTVWLSIFAHGMSALPAIRLYARHVARLPADAPEREDLLPPSRG